MNWQTHVQGRCVLAMLIVVMAAMSPGVAAAADWLRAESERFIVYSDGGERALREYVQKLETFDRVMRYQSNIKMSDAPLRKLPIYLVGSRSGLLRVYPQAPQNVVGTYFPTEEDIFAVAIRGEDDEILLHEYAHHFMLGNMPGAYPGWFVEGFAEYYMTAEIKGDKIQLGGFSQNRAYWLVNGSWIPLEVLLRSRPADVRRGAHRDTYYPVAWLLTHWFFSDEARFAQLNAYLVDVGGGGDPVEAMQRATGMSLTDLRATLRRYMRQRLVGRVLEGDFPPVAMTVERLPDSADDLLLINQRLKIGVPNDDRAALGQETLRLAARHGDDPLALLAAGHAGLHFGDVAAGERALKRLLEIQPDHVEALQFMAQARLRQAGESETEGEDLTLRNEAKGYLARAYAAANNDYRTLMLLSELRNGQSDFPNDNDLLTMGLAFDRAPQLGEVRFNYAMGLAATDQKEEAIAVLKPLAHNPHGGGGADAAEQMIETLKAGETPVAPPEDVGDIEVIEPEPDAPPPSDADAEPPSA